MADITKRANTELSGAAAFAGAAAEGFSEARPTSEGGGTPFLKIDKEDGEWSLGQENIVVPKDAELGVFPTSFAQGFVAWKGLTLEAKRMAVIGTPPVDPQSLPPVVAKTGWEPNVGVAFVIVECKTKPELEGTMCIFEQRSKGGIEAWNKLFDATMARAKGGHEKFAAIVKLDHTSYEHKEWGKVFKPLFSIEDWEDPNVLIEDFGKAPAIQSKDANDEQAQGAPVQAESRRSRRGGDDAKDVSPKEVEDAEVIDEQPAEGRRRRRRG